MEIGKTRLDRIKQRKDDYSGEATDFQATLQKSTPVTLNLQVAATLTLQAHRSSDVRLGSARGDLELHVGRVGLPAGLRDPRPQTRCNRSMVRQVIYERFET